MYDRELVLDEIAQIEEAIRRIERRFEGIASPEDFQSSDAGLDRLDAIAMMLIAIGENIKKIDKQTKGSLLAQYPQIHWPGVMGTRDVIAHDYFRIDAEEIFKVCVHDIEPLKAAMAAMRGKI